MTPIEHDPWVGEHYQHGMHGQRIAIVGFSHWGVGDWAGFTRHVVGNVVQGEKLAFFDQIRGYFGDDDSGTFWSKVMFFNFIPDMIGSGEERYAEGSPE